MSFENLLESLEEIKKSQAAADDGDEKIEQAAGVAADEPDLEEGSETVAEADADDEGADEENGAEVFGKSLSFTLEDGQVVEAVDGTELVKALMTRVENTEEVMQKALGGAIDLIKSQGEMIKSLQIQVDKLSGEGRGRKAVISIAERPTVLKKSEDDAQGIQPAEFMAKALQAQAEGKITGQDVARAEAYLNRGLGVPAEIVARVAAQ